MAQEMALVLVDENGESKGSLPRLDFVFARNQFDEPIGTMMPMRCDTHPTVFNFEPGILQSHLQLPGKLTVDVKCQSPAFLQLTHMDCFRFFHRLLPSFLILRSL